MKNKKIEERLKDSIHIESRDFLDKLLAIPIEERTRTPKWRYKGALGFCTVCLLVLAVFISMSPTNPSTVLGGNEPSKDIISFNEVSYNVGDKNNNIANSVKVYHQEKNFEYINSIYSINFNEELFADYLSDVFCYYTESSDELSHCILYLVQQNQNNERFQIGLKKNMFPEFSDESTDMWNQQEQYDTFNISTIHSQKMILIHNTKTDFKNFRTKIKINDLGIAVDGYDMDQEEFIAIIKVLIDGVKI